MKRNISPTLRDLYPELSDQGLIEAEDCLDRYLSLVLRVFERTRLDPHPPPLAPNVGTVSCTAPRSEP